MNQNKLELLLWAAVSQAYSFIGGVIGGLAWLLGDKIGKNLLKNASERTDEQGNLIDPKAAKRNNNRRPIISF